MSIEVETGFYVDLGGKLDQANRHLAKLVTKPIYRPIGGSLVVPASPGLPQLIRLSQSPARGRVWNVLKVGIFGADAHTTVANVTVDVYAGYLPGQIPYAPSAMDAISTALPVPTIVNYSTEVEWCESGEEIFGLAYGTGVVAGQMLQLVARVAEYNTYAVEADRVS